MFFKVSYYSAFVVVKFSFRIPTTTLDQETIPQTNQNKDPCKPRQAGRHAGRSLMGSILELDKDLFVAMFVLASFPNLPC